MKGIVEVDIAPGRRELGWEVGYSAQNGLTTASFEVPIILNNDADFVVKKMYVCQFGSDKPIDDTVTCQIRDGATGQNLMRVGGWTHGLCSSVAVNPLIGGLSQGVSWMRSAMQYGLPAPYVLRRGSTVFFAFTNGSGITFAGDIYVVLEGYRVFVGQPEDVPDKIKGYALPFNWNGTLVVTASATNALSKFGTITMNGLGKGQFVLKNAYVTTTQKPTVNANSQNPEPFLGLQVYSSRNQSKRWIHTTSPQALGEYMPMSCFTGGGTSYPWIQPFYCAGVDSIFVDIFGNTTWFNTNTPGTIELGLTGVYIP